MYLKWKFNFQIVARVLTNIVTISIKFEKKFVFYTSSCVYSWVHGQVKSLSLSLSGFWCDTYWLQMKGLGWVFLAGW